MTDNAAATLFPMQCEALPEGATATEVNGRDFLSGLHIASLAIALLNLQSK